MGQRVGAFSVRGALSHDGQPMNSSSTGLGMMPAWWPWLRSSATACRPRGPKSSVQSLTYMPTNSSALAIVEVAAVLQGVVEGFLTVVEAVLNRLFEEGRHLVHDRLAEVFADGVGPERQRQAGPFQPPFAEVDDQMQSLIAIGQLPFVDDEAGVGFAPFNDVEDLVELMDDVVEGTAFARASVGKGGVSAGRLPTEAEVEGQESGRQRAGDGDGFALQVVDRHRFAGDDHRAVAVPHAGSAGAEGIGLGEVGVTVQTDGGQLQFGRERPTVQGLDIDQFVREFVLASVDLVVGEGVKHEGIVGIGRVANVDGFEWHGGRVAKGQRGFVS